MENSTSGFANSIEGMSEKEKLLICSSFFRGRIQGGGDINTALGLLPDKLKTELALHVNLSVLKKVSQNLSYYESNLCTAIFNCCY